MATRLELAEEKTIGALYDAILDGNEFVLADETPIVLNQDGTFSSGSYTQSDIQNLLDNLGVFYKVEVDWTDEVPQEAAVWDLSTESFIVITISKFNRYGVYKYTAVDLSTWLNAVPIYEYDSLSSIKARIAAYVEEGANK